MKNHLDPFTPDPVPAEPRGIWDSWPLSRILGLFSGLILGNLLVQVIFYSTLGGLLTPVLAGGVLGVLLPLGLLIRRGDLLPTRDLGLDKPSAQVLLVCLLLAGAALVPTSFLAELSLRLAPADPEVVAFFQNNMPRSPAGLMLAILAVSVVGPLAEELIYRGLLHRLLSRTWGPWAGILLSSAIFGLMHFQPWLLFGLIGVGVVLAFIQETTGSTTACWITHAAHNSLALYLMFLATDTKTGPSELMPADWAWLGVSLLAMAGLGRWLALNGRPKGVAGQS